jgi:very-short-patch-repair endonuclease
MARHEAVVEALAAHGGTATSADLRRSTSRRRVQRAVADGAILRPRRGLLALPVLDETDAAVRDLAGARSHLSAALHHGWEVAAPPTRPMVTIRRDHHAPAAGTDSVRVFWGRLTDEELAIGVTSPAHTVIDCARVLPLPDAIAVADSALRSEDITQDELMEAARACPRTGRSRAVRVVTDADGHAANVFESLLRGISLDVPGLQLVPQVTVGGGELIGTADLVDVGLGIVVEAESWTYHGGRGAFDRDVRRYTAMVRAGWMVLRFLWDDVRHHPDDVRAVLVDAVTRARSFAA